MLTRVPLRVLSNRWSDDFICSSPHFEQINLGHLLNGLANLAKPFFLALVCGTFNKLNMNTH